MKRKRREGAENDGIPRGWRNSRECALGSLRLASEGSADERRRRGFTEGCRKIGEGEVLGAEVSIDSDSAS